MRPLLCLFVFLSSSVLFAESDPEKVGRNDEIIAPNSPVIAKDKNGGEPAAEKVVEMDRVTITESLVRRDLAKAIQDQEIAKADREFSWKKGGLIGTARVGKVDIDVGLWPHLKPLPPGKATDDIGIRVDILHFKW